MAYHANTAHWTEIGDRRAANKTGRVWLSDANDGVSATETAFSGAGSQIVVFGFVTTRQTTSDVPFILYPGDSGASALATGLIGRDVAPVDSAPTGLQLGPAGVLFPDGFSIAVGAGASVRLLWQIAD